MLIIALTKKAADDAACVMVLSEKGGMRRIPIVIGPFEAQAIAIGLEKIETPVMLTHDLLLHTLERNDSSLQEILIDEYNDEIFHAKLIIKGPDSVEQIPARSSDAVALAIRKPCPIFIARSILDQLGTLPDNRAKINLKDYSVAELKAMLATCLQKEDFERAQQIQEALNDLE